MGTPLYDFQRNVLTSSDGHGDAEGNQEDRDPELHCCSNVSSI